MIIYPNEVQILFKCSYATAKRKLNAVRDAFNKKRQSPISIKDFATFYELEADEVRQELTPKVKN